MALCGLAANLFWVDGEIMHYALLLAARVSTRTATAATALQAGRPVVGEPENSTLLYSDDFPTGDGPLQESTGMSADVLAACTQCHDSSETGCRQGMCSTATRCWCADSYYASKQTVQTGGHGQVTDGPFGPRRSLAYDRTPVRMASELTLAADLSRAGTNETLAKELCEDDGGNYSEWTCYFGCPDTYQPCPIEMEVHKCSSPCVTPKNSTTVPAVTARAH